MRRSLCCLLVVLLILQIDADNKSVSANAPGSRQADDNQTLIATVFGKPLYLKTVTPAEAEGKRKELPRDEFDQWLRDFRSRRIYENIWREVQKRHVEREKISVTDEELVAITKSVERRLAKSAAEPPGGLTFTPEQRKAVMIAWARATLMDWKVCRSLYEKYGGRVGIGSLGAWTAFDGQNALIREHYKSGDIKFHHAEMEEVFWRHTRITHFADAYPKDEELKRLFATPPHLWDSADGDTEKDKGQNKTGSQEP